MERDMDVVILGVNMGAASGWDEIMDNILTFYDFKCVLPGIPEGDLSVHLESGEFQIYDAAGTILLDVPTYGMMKQIIEQSQDEKALIEKRFAGQVNHVWRTEGLDAVVAFLKEAAGESK